MRTQIRVDHRNRGAVHAGSNCRDVLRTAMSLGCLIEPVRRTGEIIVSHPLVGYRVRLNGRRKDAPRALTVMLRRVGEPPLDSPVSCPGIFCKR